MVSSSVYVKSTDIFWNNTPSVILVDPDEDRKRTGFKYQ